MSVKTIYLIRHGRIDLPGGERTYVGQIDLPLSGEGCRQGVSLAGRFSRVRLDAVFASDLSRALATAGLIANAKGLTVRKRRDLREIALGEWEGLSFPAVARRYPGQFEARGRDILHFRPPGGESFADCGLRVRAAFDEIIRSAHTDIAIVAHAGVNRLLLCHVLGMPPENLFRIAQDYACVNVILSGDFGYRVKMLNYTEGAGTVRNGDRILN